MESINFEDEITVILDHTVMTILIDIKRNLKSKVKNMETVCINSKNKLTEMQPDQIRSQTNSQKCNGNVRDNEVSLATFDQICWADGIELNHISMCQVCLRSFIMNLTLKKSS